MNFHLYGLNGNIEDVANGVCNTLLNKNFIKINMPDEFCHFVKSCNNQWQNYPRIHIKFRKDMYKGHEIINFYAHIDIEKHKNLVNYSTRLIETKKMILDGIRVCFAGIKVRTMKNARIYQEKKKHKIKKNLRKK